MKKFGAEAVRGKVLTAGMPKMSKGSQPTDGGNLLLSAAEKDFLLQHNPLASKWIRKFIGAEEYINNKELLLVVRRRGIQ